MKAYYLFKVLRRKQTWACLLLCVSMLLGGCQREKPPLSKEAQALKKEMLQEMDKIKDKLVEPVSKQDWKALRPILQTSYEEMEQGGKLVPTRIMVLNRKGISRAIYPPIKKARWDFSSYKQIKKAYDNKMNVGLTGYLRGGKVYGFFVPLFQNEKLLGGVSMGFSSNDIEEKWKVSENEFMEINFN